MKITDYVSNVQTFKKSELSQLVTVLQVTASDLLGNLERMRANKINLDTQIGQWAITKSIVTGLNNNGYRGISFDKAVEAALNTVVDLSAALDKLISKDKDNVWDGKLINLRQANILMSIEQIDQWLKYTTLVYNVLISLNNKANQHVDSTASKLDLRFLTQTLEYYKGTLLWLLKGSKAITADLNNIAEVEISEASMGVMEGSGMKTLLASQSLGIHNFNPKYWWKLNRMKNHVEEIEQIRLNNEHFAMKISQAVNLKNGTNDAALEDRIEDYQDRILKGTARIAEIDNMYRSANG
jgi:hypothetical protein